MSEAKATHISLLAAPIYAALLERQWTLTRANIPPEDLSNLRGLALTQAQALWLDALDAE